MNTMNFTLRAKTGDKPVVLNYDNLFVIGYAGRNMEKTMEHIRELERELGVPAPKRIPTIFQCSNLLLTQDETFHVVGGKSSGEVEYLIVTSGGKIYIGAGSDHTDRALENVSVLKSKQVCPKPVASVLWDYEEIKGHMDSIRIRSWQILDGQKTAYQDGSLADILSADKILHELKTRVGGIGDAVIFSGTVPLKDGFRYGQTFIGELADEVLGRTINFQYNIIAISEEDR